MRSESDNVLVTMTDQQSIDALSFEDALAELETIIRNLESGQTRLDDSIAAYERGVLLRNHCEKRLNDARLKIDKITMDSSGHATGTEPFIP